MEAVRDNNLELVQEILRDLAELAEQSSTAAELARILQEPHFQVQGCWLLGVGRGAVGSFLAGIWSGSQHWAFPHYPFSSGPSFSPSWRHMTQWLQRPMRHHPQAQAWIPRLATSQYLLMRCAWWAFGRLQENTW